MKFFIDTANLEQIKEAQDLGVLDGVTTNPSLMAKEGISGTDNILKHYVDICNIVDGDVSAEVIATDYKNIIKEGENLAISRCQLLTRLVGATINAGVSKRPASFSNVICAIVCSVLPRPISSASTPPVPRERIL